MTQARQNTPRRRVAVIAPDARRLIERRAPLLRAIVAAGHDLLCVTGAAGKLEPPVFAAIGAAHDSVDFNGAALAPLGDRAAASALAATLAHWRPSAVVSFGLKPSVLTARALRSLDVARHVAVLPRLDSLETTPALGTRWAVRRAMRQVDAVAVYNGAQRDLLARHALVPAGRAVVVTPGAGVDLAHFFALPLPDLEQGLVFTLIADAPRRDKGIVEFCEAAQRVKAKAPRARFMLALGEATALGLDPAVHIAQADLAKYQDAVEIVDANVDWRELLSATHVLVAPALAEGFAHEVAAALACGRPAITSDVAGCQGLVDERVSGVVVPPGDVLALAAAIESFLRRPDLIPWMAQASRHKAERRFGCAGVNATMLALLNLSQQSAA